MCPTLCNHMDCSPPGSSAHGILQARILEWVGSHSLPQGSSRPGDWTLVSCIAGRFLYRMSHQGGSGQEMPISANLFLLALEVLATAVREEKEIKHIQIGKEVVKLSLFANDNTIYRKHEYAIKKLLELTNEFSKVVGYKSQCTRFPWWSRS